MQKICGAVNLHELHRIIRETACYEQSRRPEHKKCAAKAFAPVAVVGTDYGFDVVLIDKGIAAADSVPVGAVLECTGNVDLISQKDPGIRNHGREEQGVCGAAFGAPHTTDPEGDVTFRSADPAAVIPMNGQASVAATGAGQTVKLNGTYGRIVGILGQGIAF